jgi:arylsulfatase A-like enzyme/Tfp pilus assembly protein PilF
MMAIASGCGQQPWNVVLVTFDTTRTDRIGCYGDSRAETPNIDRLATEGVRFAQAYSASPLTTPSHSTILTGTYPFHHGVRDNGMFVLGEEQITIAEALRDAGWRTGAAVAAFPLVAQFGVDQGFEVFDDRVEQASLDWHGRRRVQVPNLFFDERPAGWVNEAILPWLEAHHTEPFFMWVHYYDPHQPHRPPPPWNLRFSDDLYRGEIAYADRSLGTLLDRLDELGVAERTVVVFTADHGEGCGDHDELTHGFLNYQTTQHVPLVIRVPGGAAGSVVHEPVATADILPTVLDLLDVTAPDVIQGRSLAAHLSAESEVTSPAARTLYAETLSPRLSRGWGEIRTLYSGRYKLMYGPRPELYDLHDDPRELADLSDERPELLEHMRAELQAFLRDKSPSSSSSRVDMDAETRRKLLALGYISGEGQDEPIEERLRSDGDPPQDHAADLSRWSSTRQLLTRGEYLAAVEMVRPLVEAHPTDRAYLELLALARIGLRQSDEAFRLFEQMQEMHSIDLVDPRIPLQLAAMAADEGDHRRALELLAVADATRPTARSAYLRAAQHEALGEVVAQKRWLNESLARDARYAAARTDRAVLLAQEGDVMEAEEELRLALSHAPYFARAWYNLGVTRLDQGDSEEAEWCFERAVAIHQKYARAHLALVRTLLDVGRGAEASSAYKRMAQALPHSDETVTAGRLVGGD